MELIAIHPHALKHGLTETDIRCAWNSAFAWFRRDLENGGIDYVLVGLDGKTASWSSLLDVAPTEMVTSFTTPLSLLRARCSGKSESIDRRRYGR